MTLLSLDQASKTSGYAVFKNKKLITFGKFTYEDYDLGQRLYNIRNKVSELIETYQPDYVVFEDIQQQNNVANNVQTFKSLAEVYGVISELLTSLRLPHSSILSTSWKSTLGIKGRTRQEQKRNAQEYVINTYHPSDKPTQDMSDAICIGTAYLKGQACAWAD